MIVHHNKVHRQNIVFVHYRVNYSKTFLDLLLKVVMLILNKQKRIREFYIINLTKTDKLVEIFPDHNSYNLLLR